MIVARLLSGTICPIWMYTRRHMWQLMGQQSCWFMGLTAIGRGRMDYHIYSALQWRHNGHDGISNHQPHDCLLKGLFGRRSKKTSNLRVTGLCAETGEFTAQMASNAENVSIWWRHHGTSATQVLFLLCVTLSYPKMTFSWWVCIRYKNKNESFYLPKRCCHFSDYNLPVVTLSLKQFTTE